MKKNCQRVKFTKSQGYNYCDNCDMKDENAYNNEEALKKRTQMSEIIVAVVQDKIDADKNNLELVKQNAAHLIEIADLKRGYSEVATKYNQLADMLNKIQNQQPPDVTLPPETKDQQGKQSENKEPEKKKKFFWWW